MRRILAFGCYVERGVYRSGIEEQRVIVRLVGFCNADEGGRAYKHH